MLAIFTVDVMPQLDLAHATFHFSSIPPLFELLMPDHAVPHHAVCHVTCVLTCIHEMPMHLACACVPMLTALPPPQVRPTDPAHREAQVMTTVAQAMLQRQVQPTAPPCGIINMPAPPRRRSLALCAQMGLRRRCEGGGAANREGSDDGAHSFAQ